MKYNTKPNQFSIHSVEEFKVRFIDAIKINVQCREITLVKIENGIEYIREKCDFFQYKEIILSGKFDCLFVGIDEDVKCKNSFRIKDVQELCHGDGIIVKLPNSGNLHKLQNTTLSIDYIKSIITFE